MKLIPLALILLIAIAIAGTAQTAGDKNSDQKPAANAGQKPSKKSFDMDDVDRSSNLSDLFSAPATSPLKPTAPTAGNAAPGSGKVINSTIIGSFQSAERSNKIMVLSRYLRAQDSALFGFVLQDENSTIDFITDREGLRHIDQLLDKAIQEHVNGQKILLGSLVGLDDNALGIFADSADNIFIQFVNAKTKGGIYFQMTRLRARDLQQLIYSAIIK